MSLTWTSLKNWLSVAASVFVGGAAGFVEAHVTDGLSGAMPWKQIAIGAVVVGAVAVTHLAQVPSNTGES